MKNLKKLSGILLAIAVLLACTVSAFAAETGSITIDNPQTSTVYKAYKIFDVVYSGDNYSYTISKTSHWLDTVSTYATTKNTLQLSTEVKDAAGNSFYNVIMKPGFSAADFAQTLRDASVSDPNELPFPATGDKKLTDLNLGYYLVTTGVGAIANLTTTNPTVIIHDKNDVPFEKKDFADSVEFGQKVNYVITGKVPDVTGFTDYTYKITDKMTAGLKFNNDVEVYLEGSPISAGFSLKTGDEAGDNDFELIIYVKDKTRFTFGQKIEVKYSATVKEAANVTISKNEAILTYSNNPNVAESTATKTSKTSVYSSQIEIVKYTGEVSNVLDGAKFVLKKKDTNEYYKYDSSTQKVTWVTLSEGGKLADILSSITVETTTGGRAYFNGLADGEYQLVETEAPAGYNMLTGPVDVTVNGGVNKNDVIDGANTSVLTVSKPIENNTGSLLPSTGGIGTTIFYIVGGVLVAAAVVLLVAKKRTSENR